MREIKLTLNEHLKFVQKMNAVMTERGMNMVELADQIGVSVRTIYNFRNDASKSPSKFTAGKIATALDMKPCDWR